MKLYFISTLIICTTLFFSCSKEEETEKIETVNGGHINLLETSIEKFPYNNPKGLIFIDDLGNEIAGTIAIVRTAFNIETTLIQIKNSTSQFYLERHKQHISTTIRIPDINREILIKSEIRDNLSDYESIKLTDVMIINSSSIQGFHRDINEIFIVVDERSMPGAFPNANQTIPTLTINGITFTDVYSNENNDTFVIYFTFDQKIIGFKDKTTGISYTLK